MFSFDNLDDPKRQALLMLAAGLLSPVRSKGMSGFGEALGKGIQGGLLGLNQGQEAASRRKQQQLMQQMQQAQLGDIQSKQAAMRGIGQAFQPGIPAMPSPDDGGPESGMIPGKPPGYDTTSAAFLEAARMRPDVAQQFMQKPKPPLVMSPGATAYDQTSNKPLFTAPSVPEKADKPPELIRYQQIADDPKQPETLRRAAKAYIAKATYMKPEGAEAVEKPVWDAERGGFVSYGNGSPSFTPVPNIPTKAGKSAPEGQLVAAGYASRMIAADKIISGSDKSGVPDFAQAVLNERVPMLGNYTANPKEQLFRQAQEDWVRAKLRKESGAVISDEEMAREIRVYFPQPGDGQAVIKQKAEARKRANDAMLIAAGGAASMIGGGSTGVIDFNDLPSGGK